VTDEKPDNNIGGIGGGKRSATEVELLLPVSIDTETDDTAAAFVDETN